MQELRTFDYDEATNTRVIKSSHSLGSSHSEFLGQFKTTKTLFDDDYLVLDSQKVPPNTLENIHKRLVKVNRHFQRLFQSQEQLDKAIKDNCVSDKNGNITVDQFKQFVLTHLKDDMINKHINKKDVEGFLSAFIYNAYGATNVNNIAPLVFTDDNFVAKKLNHRVRGNPPPPEVNGDIVTTDIADDAIHTANV